MDQPLSKIGLAGNRHLQSRFDCFAIVIAQGFAIIAKDLLGHCRFIVRICSIGLFRTLQLLKFLQRLNQCRAIRQSGQCCWTGIETIDLCA